MSLSLTLAVLKPDLVLHPMHLAAVRRSIVESKFWVVRSALITLSKEQAGAFYAEHEGKFFHQRLVEHMTSGPCQPLILAKVNAIQDWRSLMGPTKVFQARFSQPSSLRGQFGLTDTRNCCHGSDSEETARREMDFFFPNFDPSSFPTEEEVSKWEGGQMPINWDQFVHSSS